ncbi:hypothetical protein BC833DRAFT_610319 [Globomyces pollinis-pini]|nr:hypothetical protein BC833DRAFT_610319 [Globomyces pollinis-pini]
MFGVKSNEIQSLIQQFSNKLKDSTIFVLWPNKHRISKITGIKNERQINYTIHTIDKYFILSLSWYRVSTFYHTTDLKSIVKNDKSLKKYMTFDGKQLSDWKQDKSKNIDEEFDYKTDKYLPVLIKCINDTRLMEKWLIDQQIQGKLAYKTLLFLFRTDMNPLTPKGTITDGFSNTVRQQIIKNWKAKSKVKTIIIKSGGQTVAIELIKDCVGLWVCDHKTKQTHLSDIDCFQGFDVEHVISNSYGVDNNDITNGVLLDSRINRKKSNTILFLVDIDVIQRITELKMEQKKYFKSLQPFYKRWF